MPSIRDIRRRMKSVQNTGKITRAMEAVAATKMRKAQQVALAARPYAEKALEILGRISDKTEHIHWLLEARSVERMALILVTSDKGLCGVLNHNVLHRFEEFAESHREFVKTGKCDFVAVGNYGAKYLKRRGFAVAREFSGVGDYAKLDESRPVADFILGAYHTRTYDQVFAIYTNFVSTLKQAAVLRQVLPLTQAAIEGIAGLERGAKDHTRTKAHSNPSTIRAKGSTASPMAGGAYFYEYTFEPSPKEVLEMLLPALVRVRIHQIILESNASEHSARMIAMKNASDNAEELFEELQLSFNKARQAGITREIAEITAGAAALEA